MTTRAEEPLSIVQETTRTRLSLGRQRLAPPQLVAICLSSLGAICALIALWQSWPVECSVAGVPYRLRHGARIQEALKAAQIDVRAGDLISLRGAVLQPGGGALPSVWREGQSVALSEFVRAHDRLIVVPATDMREPVFEKAILLPLSPKQAFCRRLSSEHKDYNWGGSAAKLCWRRHMLFRQSEPFLAMRLANALPSHLTMAPGLEQRHKFWMC